MVVLGAAKSAMETIQAYYQSTLGIKLSRRQVVSLCINTSYKTGSIFTEYNAKRLVLRRVLDKDRQPVTLSEEDKKIFKEIKQKIRPISMPDSMLLSSIIQDAGRIYLELSRVRGLAI